MIGRGHELYRCADWALVLGLSSVSLAADVTCKQNKKKLLYLSELSIHVNLQSFVSRLHHFGIAENLRPRDEKISVI